jgi:hypothetical protein
MTWLGLAAAKARAALQGTTDEHPKTNWQLKAHGAVVGYGPDCRLNPVAQTDSADVS